MYLRRFFVSVQSAAERLGPDTLDEGAANPLSRERAGILLQYVPAISLAGGLIALAMMFCAMAGAGNVASVLLLATAALGHLAAWRASIGSSNSPGFLPSHARRRMILSAAAFGIIWGAAMALLLSSDSGPPDIAAFSASVGMIALAVMVTATYPAAGIAFLVPFVAGALTGVSALPQEVAFSAATIIVVFTMALPFLALGPTGIVVQSLVDRRQLREQTEIVRLLLNEFSTKPSDWLWRFDENNHIAEIKNRFATAAGLRTDEIEARDFFSLIRALSPENEVIALELEDHVDRQVPFHDIVVKIDGKREQWWRLSGKPCFDDTGAYTGYVGAAFDITAERLAERRINFLAHHDALTGLLNRGKFTENLNQAVARLERYGSPFTVLYLDLDQFKAVNDSRGHLTGDKLLVEVSRRLTAAIRETELAARLGGDEFAIIMSNNCDQGDAASLAARLVDAICKPYDLDGEIVSLGVSIGIAMAPINGTRPDQILRNADLALYRAKAEGRATFRFFESQMDSSMRERRMLELEMRQALEYGEFVLHYQPLVSASDNQATGFEALIRWNHPIRGVVPPAEFIPIAEQTGLIQQIGDWTIHEACRAAARWPADLVVAVNLSANHFQMSDIVAVVRDALTATKLAPERLELEITESLLIQRTDEVIEKLRRLKALGVTIAMDDFGAGYSSLSYLLKFPFDKIKIDKSFVTASSDDAVARDILRTIASLGRSLKIRVTAEGVETLEQVEFLKGIDCNQLQGYYFARPLDEVELAAYFMQRLSRRIVPPAGSVEKAANASMMPIASRRVA